MPTLREAIRRRKNPDSYYEEKIQDLVRQLERIISEADTKIQKAIDEARNESVFRDLEPAKELAKKVAKEEVSGMKSDIEARVNSVLGRTDSVSKSVLAEAKVEINRIKDEFTKKLGMMESKTNEALNGSKMAHDSAIKDMTDMAQKTADKAISTASEALNRATAQIKLMKGEKGDPGQKGDPGKDGSPDKPEEVVAKVNKSKTKVQQSAIEGLQPELRNIKRSIRDAVSRDGGGGGGGMGNPQHETTATSSATTTVSTTYKIAAAGFAIWAYYNGQLIQRGVHYTVGSDLKTLTLTFTPSDDTNIDLIYIRS